MRLISSLALATAMLLGCAQPPAPQLTATELAAAIKEIESKPPPTPDEVKRFAYVESSLPLCVRMLPMLNGLKDVTVIDAYEYCNCIHGAGAEGLTAADIDEIRRPGGDGRYTTDKGLALMKQVAKRMNAAEPECRAKALSKYWLFPK